MREVQRLHIVFSEVQMLQIRTGHKLHVHSERWIEPTYCSERRTEATFSSERTEATCSSERTEATCNSERTEATCNSERTEAT